MSIVTEYLELLNVGHTHADALELATLVAFGNALDAETVADIAGDCTDEMQRYLWDAIDCRNTDLLPSSETLWDVQQSVSGFCCP